MNDLPSGRPTGEVAMMEPRACEMHVRGHDQGPEDRAIRAWGQVLAERERALAAREQAVEEQFRLLNKRESSVAAVEEHLVAMVRAVAAEAFRRGVAEARDQDATLAALDAALALPVGMEPVAVDLRACGYEATARVMPGSGVSAAAALASVIDAIDDAEGIGV